MGILTDLNISYEMLADDPIETGIRFGKSILDAMPAQIMQVFNNEAVYADAEFIRRPVVSRSREIRRSVQASSPSRGSYDSARYRSDYFFENRSVARTGRIAVGVI